MPRDTTALLDAPPDLSEPTLEGLAWLLRHREAWPVGFGWHLKWRDTCAQGLGDLFWGKVAVNDLLATVPLFSCRRIFHRGSWWHPERITSEMVADRIDALAGDGHGGGIY